MYIELSNRSELRAVVAGIAYTKLPNDLFIPPDALEVLLDSFSGPLDLLLYLIRKQNIDILDIPMTSITKQYLQYIRLKECRQLELAADYLLMAAMLAEIKSRLLLPITPNSEEEQEEDPRMTLVRRLQAYEQIKQAAQWLDGLPRQDRDHFLVQINPSEIEYIKKHPEVELADLIDAIKSLVRKEEHFAHHQIVKEALTVRERITSILFQLQEHEVLEFTQLFSFEEGRMGPVFYC